MIRLFFVKISSTYITKIHDPNVKGYTSIEELMEDLNSEED